MEFVFEKYINMSKYFINLYKYVHLYIFIYLGDNELSNNENSGILEKM